MNIGDLYFTFRGESQQLVADAQKSGAAAGDAGGKSFGQKFKSQLTAANLGRGVTQGLGLGAGFIGVQLLAKGIQTVTDVMGDSIAAFKAEQASIALLTEAVKANDASWDGNMASIEAVISSRERLAFSDDEQRESLRTLVAVTKDHEEALRLQGIAMDLARLRGIDLGTAGDIVGKVYGGNIGILTRYGIQLDKGTTSTEALLEVQKLATGQAEAYADTVEGRSIVSQIRLNNAMEKVGEILAPLALGMAEFAADVLPPLADALANTAEAFHNVWRFMNPGLALLEDTEKAIRSMAEARGLDADAAIALFRADNALAETQARVLELQKEIDRVTIDGTAHGDIHAQSLIDQRDALLGVAKASEKVTDATQEVTVSAEASAAAAASLARNLDKLPSDVTIQVRTPGIDKAISTLGLLSQYVQGGAVSADSFRTPLPRRGGGVGRASGGSVHAGLAYTVGERGPELFLPDVSGRVLDHETSRQMVSDARGGDQYSIELNTYGLPLQAETPMEVAQQLRRAARLGTVSRMPRGWKK